MLTRLLFSLVCLASVALPARAQLTLTSEDLLGLLGTQTSSTTYTATDPATLQAVAGLTGANQTFDFSTATYDDGESFSSELVDSCSDDIPGCDDEDFSTANLIFREIHTEDGGDSVAVVFSRIDADGFYLLGAAARGDFDETPGEDTVTVKYDPAYLIQKLPLTMGTTWTASTQFETPQFEDAGIAFMISDSSAVDGWGTLVTPEGSADALRVWSRSISGFTFGEISVIDTTYTIEFVTATTYGASLFLDADGTVLDASYTVLGTSGGTPTEPVAERPSRIELHPNFPNPFNPSTTIAFDLQEAGFVSLTVLDLLGREVSTLVHEVRPAGSYQVSWEAGPLPSGVYLYRLQAGAETRTRSLTLIK